MPAECPAKVAKSNGCVEECNEADEEVEEEGGDRPCDEAAGEWTNEGDDDEADEDNEEEDDEEGDEVEDDEVEEDDNENEVQRASRGGSTFSAAAGGGSKHTSDRAA
ncbi:hypothetical protein ANO11243_090540 [Dothideomycetidae sp. 11243]|nr:hypothetical protein ANO11243_090540 [fungal sp. No.11243]